MENKILVLEFPCFGRGIYTYLEPFSSKGLFNVKGWDSSRPIHYLLWLLITAAAAMPEPALAARVEEEDEVARSLDGEVVFVKNKR